MFRKPLQSQDVYKRRVIKNKATHSIHSSSLNQITIKLIYSITHSVLLPIPINCPMKILNEILSNTLKQSQYEQPLGFQKVPSDYAFDYRLKQQIGYIQNKNFTLKCLFKNKQLQNYIKNENNQKYTYYKINKYKICNNISSGGFSRVYLVRNLIDGKFYAAKFMDKKSYVNINRGQTIKNEFNIHKMLSHPFIVKMYEYIQTVQFVILILEYCPGGQLFNLLKKNRYMKQQKAKIIFLQVLMSIDYLHQRNIIYRDIKPENILIDVKGNVKLADFGLAKQIRQKTNSYCGSVEYMAPEIISKQIYSFSVDLYCMGALLYQILIGCPPFYNPKLSLDQIKYHITNSEISFPANVPLSDEVKDLMSTLLKKDPVYRFGHQQGVKQILNHSWLEQVNIESLMKHQIVNPFIPNVESLSFQHLENDFEEEGFMMLIMKEINFYSTFYQKAEPLKQNRLHFKQKSLNDCFFQKYRKQSMYTKKVIQNNPYQTQYCQKDKQFKFVFKNYQQKYKLRGFSLNKNHLSGNISRSKSRKNHKFEKTNLKKDLFHTLLVSSKSQKRDRYSSSKIFVKNLHQDHKNTKQVVFSRKYCQNPNKQLTTHRYKYLTKLTNLSKYQSLNKRDQKQNINTKKQTENNSRKQLKKKNIKNKKKFVFSSMPKSVNQ